MPTTSTQVVASPALVLYIGRECGFTYNGKLRSGRIESVQHDTFTVEVCDLESQFKTFRFDRVEDDGRVLIL